MTLFKIRTIVFGCCLVLGSMALAGQPYYIQVSVRQMSDEMVYLNRFDRTEFLPIDSVALAGGSGYFPMAEADLPAIYSLTFGKPATRSNQAEGYIEFIWNRENLVITADAGDLAGSVTFGESIENQVLGQFRQEENLYESKMAVLHPLVDRYPEKDEFYRMTTRHFEQIQVRRDSLIDAYTKRYPDLFATRIIASYRSPFIPAGLKRSAKVGFLKEHFFDEAPIDDPALLHAPVYSRKIIDYLSLYRAEDITFAEQQDAFIEAVDMIMANVSADTELRTFVIEYLLEGFHSFQMEAVEAHIAENFIDETCTTDVMQLAKARAEGFKRMSVGQTASDIVIRDHADNTIRLSDLDADYALVMFWAAHCGHCLKLLPKLKTWYTEEKPPGLEVFAISIDTVRQAWTRYLAAADLPWINAHEPLGWEGRSAEDYNIYATPTMFLLNRKREIIAKPMNLWELKREIRKLEQQ